MHYNATCSRVIEASQNGRLCFVGFGVSAADLLTVILLGDSTLCGRARRQRAANTLGCPDGLPGLSPEAEDQVPKRAVRRDIPIAAGTMGRDPREVPIIDKHRVLASGFEWGRLVGHRPIPKIVKGRDVQFRDRPTVGNSGVVPTSGVRNGDRHVILV